MVVGNCWLPPMAGHNLIGASELVTAFSSDSSTSTSVVAAKKIPSSLDELLTDPPQPQCHHQSRFEFAA